MSHTVHDKKKLLARVRRIKGQTGALESALEQGNRLRRHPAADCRHPRRRQRPDAGGAGGHMREHLGAEEATHAERLEDLDQVVRYCVPI